MKTRNVIIAVLVLLAAAVLLAPKVIAWRENQRRTLLARELRKAISASMLDLSQAKSGTLRGVPPDGQWHHRAVFETLSYGLITYTFDGRRLNRRDSRGSQVIAAHVENFSLRRLPQEKMIVDVRITLQEGSSLTSNARIRLRD